MARLMRQNGIAGVTRRRRRDLTKPDAGAAAVPDGQLVARHEDLDVLGCGILAR